MCRFGFLDVTAAAIKFCVYAAILITLIFSDLEERILPDEFTLGGAVAGVVIAVFVPLNWGLVALLLHSIHNIRLISVGESIFSGALLRRGRCGWCGAFTKSSGIARGWASAT